MSSPTRVRPSHVHPSWIARQRYLGWPDMHPEDYCHKCGARNVVWSFDGDWHASTKAWQAETGREGICCIPCFLTMHEAATGRESSWVLTEVTA